MNLESIRDNKKGMILQYAVPSIVAMVLTSLITVVDGFFIGNYVGKEGLAAINMGLPIVYLYLAVGLMISVGGVAIAGMALGGQNTKACKNVFNQTICTVVGLATLLSVIVFFCMDPLLSFLQADRQVATYFKDYYLVLLLQLPVMVLNASFGMFVRSEGNPQFFMKTNALTVVLNVLLDYIFVRGFGWGVRGIATASLLATVAALFFLLFFFIKQARVYKFGVFEFSKETFRGTMLNGSSEFVGEMSLSISMFAYNYIILKYVGVEGVSAFTIVGYVSYIFSMILIGFGQGASPLISFTYGAREAGLAADLRKRTNRMVFLAGAIVFILAIAGSGWYSGLFIKNEAVERMVESGIALFAVSFLFSGINTITSFYFTSIGKAKESAIISSLRGFALLLVCIFVLPPLLGMTGVWLVAPITEAVTLMVSLLFLSRDNRQAVKLAV